MRNGPTRPPASSTAIRMPRTIVSDCCLALPVRGRLDTILTSVGSAGRQPLVGRTITDTIATKQTTTMARMRMFMGMNVGVAAKPRQTRPFATSRQPR